MRYFYGEQACRNGKVRASLDEALAQVAAAQHVHMEVQDRLAGIMAGVGNHAEAVLEALGLCDLVHRVSTGAWGFRSSNAMTSSSSYTVVEGIS